MERSLGSKSWLAAESVLTIVVRMSNEAGFQTYEDRAWQYFLQLQPSIADVNAAAELAFRAVDAFERQLKRRTDRSGDKGTRGAS